MTNNNISWCDLGKNRGKLDIIYDMINEVRMEEEKNKERKTPVRICKTRIMGVSNLSYERSIIYFPFCLKQEFLQYEKGEVAIGPNGYDFLEHYEILKGLCNVTLQTIPIKVNTQRVVMKKILK
jgi:predicted transcriptional regulator